MSPRIVLVKIVSVRPSRYCGAHIFICQIGSTGRKKTGSSTSAASSVMRRSVPPNRPIQYRTWSPPDTARAGYVPPGPPPWSASVPGAGRDLGPRSFDLLRGRPLDRGNRLALEAHLDVALHLLV